MVDFPNIVWMGILNITPDSFSDGGRFLSVDRAVMQAQRLIEEGATVLDIGGESTRPFSKPVSAQEEIDRVIPVIEAVRKVSKISISLDTKKPEVLKAALPYRIQILNDVSGGENEELANLVRDNDLTWLIMHTQGTPESMQINPKYPKGVVEEVSSALKARVTKWVEFGIPLNRLWVDPGIGFGKTVEHNLSILKNLTAFSEIGGKLALGTSRKSFIASLESGPAVPPNERLGGTLATTLWGYTQGASVFRVHEVFPNKQALRMWKAIHESQ